MSDLVGNPEDRFSRVAAQMIKMGKSIRHKWLKPMSFQALCQNVISYPGLVY